MTKIPNPNPNQTNAQSKTEGEKTEFCYQTFGLDRGPTVDSTGTERCRKPHNFRPLLLLLAIFLVVKAYFIYSYIPTCSDCAPSTAPPHHTMATTPPSTSTNPRETIIDLQSDSVTGSYSLYDLLSIHTTSGNIDITISLHNASASSPQTPAILRLSTASGSIRVRTSTLSSETPTREYKSELRSQSGSIDAILVHGSHTSLTTSSGSIRASLSPHNSTTTTITRSEILTSTQSGDTDVTVHPVLGHEAAPLRRLWGDYRHASGGLRVAYPSTWEGRVHGSTASGGIGLRWEGMRVVKDRRGTVGREFEAVKGEGDGVLRFQGSSGSVQLNGDSDYWVRPQGARSASREEPPARPSEL